MSVATGLASRKPIRVQWMLPLLPTTTTSSIHWSNSIVATRGRYGTTHSWCSGSGALPSRHSGSGNDRIHDVFTIDPFVDISRTIEADMERIERRMERAMERMQSPGLDQDTHGRKYTREWRDERAHSKMYFSESVTIMRPEGGTRSRNAHHQGMGQVWLIIAGMAAMLWYQGTKRFLQTYEYSTFSDDSKWKLMVAWPLLLLTSPKFRHEWERASARSNAGPVVKPPLMDDERY